MDLVDGNRIYPRGRKMSGPGSSYPRDGGRRHILEMELRPQLVAGRTYFIDQAPIRFKEYLAEERLHFEWPDTLQPVKLDELSRHSPLVDVRWAAEMIAAGRLKGLSEIAAGRAPHMVTPELGPEDVLEIDPGAEFRILVLRALDERGPAPKPYQITQILKATQLLHPKAAASYCGGKTPEVRTVQNWLKERGSPGKRSHAASMSRQGRTKRARRIDEFVEAVILEEALQYWAIRSFKKSEVHDRVCEVVEKELAKRTVEGRECGGIRLPSPSTVSKIVDAMASFDNWCAKHGPKRARELFKLHGPGLEARANLDLCVIDHTILDCIAVDPEFGTPIGRPVLTVMICVYSRCILAFVLSFEPAGLYGALECVRRANRPKIGCWLSDQFPALAHIYGKPREIVCDNGLEFVGTSFRSGLYDLGIGFRTAPLKHSWYKGVGERFFGTLNTMGVHNWPGTTLNQYKRILDDVDVGRDALFTVHELEELIWRTISTYHVDAHSSLKQPPAHVWTEYGARHGIPYFEDDGVLVKMLGTARTRRLRPRGIRLFGLHYKGAGLQQMIDDLRPEHIKRSKGIPIEVPIKFNQVNLLTIYAWNKARSEYVELTCTEPDYADGLTKFQHDQLKIYANKCGEKFSTPQQRRKLRIALRDEMYRDNPKLLQRVMRVIERLRHKPAMQKFFGATATGELKPSLARIPQEPFANLRTDGGELPVAHVRGAAKTANKRRRNKAAKERQAEEAREAATTKAPPKVTSNRPALTTRYFNFQSSAKQIPEE